MTFSNELNFADVLDTDFLMEEHVDNECFVHDLIECNLE